MANMEYVSIEETVTKLRYENDYLEKCLFTQRRHLVNIQAENETLEREKGDLQAGKNFYCEELKKFQQENDCLRRITNKDVQTIDSLQTSCREQDRELHALDDTLGRERRKNEHLETINQSLSMEKAVLEKMIDNLEIRLKTSEAAKKSHGQMSNGELKRMKEEIDYKIGIIDSLKKSNLEKTVENTALRCKVQQYETLYKKRISKLRKDIAKTNDTLTKQNKDLTDQVTRQKRELDRKNSGITTMLQAIAAKMKSNDPKKAALSAPAVTECHERKKAATFNEEMKLSEMFDWSVDDEQSGNGDAIKCNNENVDIKMEQQEQSSEKVYSPSILPEGSSTCRKCTELEEEFQNLQEKYRLQCQINTAMEQPNREGLNHWADVAINIVMDCFHNESDIIKQGVLVEDWKKKGFSKATILKRLISAIDRSYKESKRMVREMQDELGCVDGRLAEAIFEAHRIVNEKKKKMQSSDGSGSTSMQSSDDTSMDFM